MKRNWEHHAIHEETNKHAVNRSINNRAFDHDLYLPAGQVKDRARHECDGEMQHRSETRGRPTAFVRFSTKESAGYRLKHPPGTPTRLNPGVYESRCDIEDSSGHTAEENCPP